MARNEVAALLLQAPIGAEVLEGPARIAHLLLQAADVVDGNVRRAIDIYEGERVHAGTFKALVRAAVDLNTSVGKAGSKR